MGANETTVNAIFANIKTVLTDAEGLAYIVEDLSENPTLSTDFLQILYTGENFENEYGERPEYNEIEVLIRGQGKATSPAAARSSISGMTHDLRDNLKPSTLNIGSLATSKLITFVAHNGMTAIYENALVKVEYRLTVQYREQ